MQHYPEVSERPKGRTLDSEAAPRGTTLTSQWLDQSTHKGPSVSVHALGNCRQFEQRKSLARMVGSYPLSDRNVPIQVGLDGTEALVRGSAIPKRVSIPYHPTGSRTF